MPKGWVHQAATHVAYSCHTHAEKVFINYPLCDILLKKKDTPALKWHLEHSSGLCKHFLTQGRWEVCIFCFKGKPRCKSHFFLFMINKIFPKMNVIWNLLALTVCWRCGIPPSHKGQPPGREGGGGEGRRRRRWVGGQVASHCCSSSSSFNILSWRQEKILPPQPTWIGANLQTEDLSLFSFIFVRYTERDGQD